MKIGKTLEKMLFSITCDCE